MEPIVIVTTIVVLILLLLFLGASFKPVRFVGNLLIKFVIGAMLLFFLNAFGGTVGLHVPINLTTAGIAGFLGFPVLMALAAIQYWVL